MVPAVILAWFLEQQPLVLIVPENVSAMTVALETNRSWTNSSYDLKHSFQKVPEVDMSLLNLIVMVLVPLMEMHLKYLTSCIINYRMALPT